MSNPPALSELSEQSVQAARDQNKAPRPLPGKPVFVDLGQNYPAGYTWSNDPKDMSLDTYFDPGKSNLADEFAIDGLRPILKDTNSEMYLLTANNAKFYLWAADDGRLFVFKDDLKLTLDTAIDEVLSGIKWSNLLQQFNKNYD
ncbi:hypothetical protein AYO21_11980 [Fonsecaea monophora]|uniref:Uncharacterized protein n=1 Tax=Fonsecaea monophora TaxID=254056 RepID=A0A177EPQ3_9EURO|nr:hypothetical protein AYO21_11980 [Fonsecaea monophora]OAG33908.1 hypothetical protein AYO21_11980 [Fonsecaea monophora]